METSLFRLGKAKFGIKFKIHMKLQQITMNSKRKSEVGGDLDVIAAMCI